MNALHPAAPPAETAALVAALLRIVPADKVFCREGCLFIVLGEAAARSLQQYRVILEGADWNPQRHPYSLYTLTDVCAGLDSGNLFFNTVFTAAHLVYDSGQSALPLPLPQRVAAVREGSRAEFRHGFCRSQSFFRASVRCAGEAPEVAAFLLHQAAELALRAFILALSGREVKTHGIAELLQRGRRYAPALQRLFSPAQQPLLDLLDKAYVCARYSRHYHVPASGLQALYPVIRRLQQQLRRTFDQAMDHYREQERP